MRLKYFYLSLCLLIATSINCFAQLTSEQEEAINDFRQILNTELLIDNLHGSISIAVVKDNQVIWAGALGYSHIQNETSADTNTIYRIGSITKTFTSTILMQLVEEGKIKLDDPVEPFVPEIKKLKGYSADYNITFRELASHTAGLKREPDMSGADDGSTAKWESKLITCISHTGFNSKPGQAFLYSNMGVAILGLALERVTNIPYIQMVQDRILKPLRMDDTFFVMPKDKLPRLAEGIANNEKGKKTDTKLPHDEISGRGYRVPNGGIFSTPADLAKFAISMMVRPTLLKPESLKEMQTVPPGGDKYGLGLMLVRNGKVNIFGHDGSVAGYTSQMAIGKNTGYAVILMRNYNFGSTNLAKASFALLNKL